MILRNKKSVFLLSSYLLLFAYNLPAHSQGYIPGLGEIMTVTSTRHAKLALAGQAQNWALAEYELEELKEGFADAKKFHPSHKQVKNVGKLIAQTMDAPMRDLEKAIQAKNLPQFNEHFDQLTAACNACHQMTAFGFNVVIRPSSNPFVNQDFSAPLR